MNAIHNLLRNEDGTTAIEYALMAAAITAGLATLGPMMEYALVAALASVISIIAILAVLNARI